MCYFLMKSNIRRRKSSLPQTEYTVILEEIHKLHFSFNQKDYEDLLKKTFYRLKSSISLKEFHDYFINSGSNLSLILGKSSKHILGSVRPTIY